MGRIFEAPIARKNFSRFARTCSRESHSVKPRLRTFSAPLRPVAVACTSLMPPGRVLKPWISQSSRERLGDCRTCRALARGRFHGALFALRDCRFELGPLPGAARFTFVDVGIGKIA